MRVPHEFFGMMFQGYPKVALDGTVQPPYFPIPVGLVRDWDTAPMGTIYDGVDKWNLDGVTSQLLLAKKLGAKFLHTFGFSGDPAHPPPSAALLDGSRNRPKLDYLLAVADAVIARADLLGVTIDIFELGNEHAVGDLYWDGTPEQSYEQSVILGAHIKARQPNAIILPPSFNDLLMPYGIEYATRYVSLMKKHGLAADGIAFHAGYRAPDEKYLHAELANLDRACDGLDLDYYCTEYWGPPAWDIYAARGIKLLTWNGQHGRRPYEDSALAEEWNARYTRMTTAGPNVPVVPDARKRSGCF